MALTALTFGLFRLRKPKEISDVQKTGIPKELRTPINAWVALNREALDTHELDLLLSDSSHESDETRRGRRSRFIREMNAWGQLTFKKDVVIRERDSHDRRRAVYLLDPSVMDMFNGDKED
jgi:hypothetical protein